MEDKMRDAVRAACEQLDPRRDDHWTSDGRPAVAAVRSLASDESITRGMIREVLPDLARGSSSSEEPTQDSSMCEDVSFDQLQKDIESVREYLCQVHAEEVDARKRYREADAALSELIAKRDAIDPLSDDVRFAQHWQRRQHEERERAAAREPGSQMSALDRAFALRRTRSTYPRNA